MKRRKQWIAAAAGIILLPLLFAAIMRREVNGSLTTFTVRGTSLCMYQSDSGNLAFGRGHDRNWSQEPDWLVTRKHRAAWEIANACTLCVELPFGIIDILAGSD